MNMSTPSIYQYALTDCPYMLSMDQMRLLDNLLSIQNVVIRPISDNLSSIQNTVMSPRVSGSDASHIIVTYIEYMLQYAPIPMNILIVGDKYAFRFNRICRNVQSCVTSNSRSVITDGRNTIHQVKDLSPHNFHGITTPYNIILLSAQYMTNVVESVKLALLYAKKSSRRKYFILPTSTKYNYYDDNSLDAPIQLLEYEFEGPQIIVETRYPSPIESMFAQFSASADDYTVVNVADRPSIIL